MTQQEALFKYLLRIADNHLILGHRLSEQSSKGPFLEEDIACSNIALDLLGSANSLYIYAAQVEGKGRSEDDLAFLRNEREFYNSLLSEQPSKDFAFVMARQFLMDAFEYLFLDALQKSSDQTISALASKSLKETTYHLRHSSNWIIRLGDGTETSHSKIQNAINALWCYTDELFEMTEVDQVLLSSGIAVDLSILKSKWNAKISEIFAIANLEIPNNVFMQRGSRDAVHSEHLGYLLAEMQHIHRSFPGVKW